MNLLLDTHAFLWWVTDDSQLSATIRSLIINPENTIYFSVASAWEIVIKQQAGKLTLPEPAAVYLPSRLTANRFLTQTLNWLTFLKLLTCPIIIAILLTAC